MHRRCNRPPGHHDYPSYAGRGIRVCPQWNVYATFAADIGPHLGKGWSIDRIDNDADYRPGNVRWATHKTQNRNRKNTLRACDVAAIRALYQGDCRSNRGGLSYQAIADMYGVGCSTIKNILLGNTWV